MKTIKENKIFNDLDFVDFIKPDEYKNVPKKISGVYILLNKNSECIYVGKSVCVRKRLYHHYKGLSRNDRTQNIMQETEFITYCEIPLAYELDLYETLLINHFKPLYNVDKLYEIKSRAINKVIETKKEIEVEKFNKSDLKDFLIKFFKINKGVEVSVATLKMICENNGYDVNILGTCHSLTQLKDLDIVYKNGCFVYAR